MPRGDGTGPAGMGPMTGRAAGYCAGYSVPGFMNRGSGRGLGMAWGRGGGGGRGLAWRRGRGGGWGRGWGFGPAAPGPAYVPPVQSAEQELDMLRSQSDWLKEQMQAIDARIQELQQTKD
jgi:hypothetical protein